MVGFLDKNIYELKEKRMQNEKIYSEYIGERVELSIKNTGRLEGRIRCITDGKYVLDIESGKKPVIVNIDDISLLNPLD